MNFIFTHDGTAVNVNHIVTIFVHSTSKPDGYVVRCSLVPGLDYIMQLSPILPNLTDAQRWRDACIKDVLNPRPERSPDAGA